MKYLKLYFVYAKNSLMGKLVYKSNVIIGIIAFLFTQITALLTLYLLVSAVPSIDGYSLYEIGFLFGLTNMAVGIDHLLSDRLWTVSYFEVKTGKMDYLFLRPLPILFQILASEIQLEALGEIIVAIVLLIFCGIKINFNATPQMIILLIIGVICAAVIITSFKILIAGLAFIFKRTGPLLQFIYDFSTYSKYPLTIFPKFIQYILLFIIPLGLCIFIPYDNLLNNLYNPYIIMGIIIAITFIFSSICIFIWIKCSKKYESTGT